MYSMPFSPRGGSWDQARQSAQLTAPTPLPSLWVPQAPGKNLPQLSPALLHHPSYPQTLVSRHTFTPLAPAVSVRWPTEMLCPFYRSASLRPQEMSWWPALDCSSVFIPQNHASILSLFPSQTSSSPLRHPWKRVTG